MCYDTDSDIPLDIFLYIPLFFIFLAVLEKLGFITKDGRPTPIHNRSELFDYTNTDENYDTIMSRPPHGEINEL